MATQDECSSFWQNKVRENIFKGFPDLKSKQAEIEYKEKCGMYDKKVLDCISLNTEIQGQISALGNQALLIFENDKNKNLSSYLAKSKKEFNDNNCTQLIEKYRQSELGDVVGKFSALDKARIEAESIYERNQRIFFGGLVLIGGIVIITMFSKKK